MTERIDQAVGHWLRGRRASFVVAMKRVRNLESPVRGIAAPIGSGIWGCALGFRFRKSKSFGPVRITASKRGVSASIGAGPFRVTKSSTGRTTSTVRIPGTGVSYVATSSSRGSTRAAAGRGAAKGASARVPRQSRSQPVRMVISDETWRGLLSPDGTAAASKFQRNFVRAAVARATGQRPSLMHLTLGQAQRILECVGQSPAKLTAGGRGVPGMEKAGSIAQWALFGVLILIVTVSSPAGFLLAAGIVGLMFLLRKRRHNRQVWEDANWAVASVNDVQSVAAPDVPIEAPTTHAVTDPAAFGSLPLTSNVRRPVPSNDPRIACRWVVRSGRTSK